VSAATKPAPGEHIWGDWAADPMDAPCTRCNAVLGVWLATGATERCSS
jgi:hypothetical protein